MRGIPNPYEISIGWIWLIFDVLWKDKRAIGCLCLRVVVANVDMAYPDMILGGFVISGYDPPSEISDGL